MEGLVCESCWTKIFNSGALQAFWLGQRYDFEYKSSWQNIVRNADSGCNWCSFLKAVLPYPTDPMWPQEWTTDQDLTISLGEARVSENVSPKGLNQCELDFGTEDSPRDWHAELDLFTDKDNLAAHLITARPLQAQVSSSEAYAQIKHWPGRCQAHKECFQSPINMLPRRVIEVAPADSPEAPRLLETQEIQGHYLALSYCWGARQEYLLTAANRQSCLQKLDMSKLSRTISEAIEVTRALGFDYLWADALCIVQDSEQDKIRELSVMHRIYEYSALTIVAASAASANEGFLQPRIRSERKTFRIPCRLGEGTFSVINLQEHEQYDDLSEPVNKRAWTLQEQLLSPRLLIYASHTVQWQCRALTCNLGDSYHAPNLSSIPRLPIFQPNSTASHQDRAFSDPREQSEMRDRLHELHQHWMRVIISYSNRSTTMPNDKLTAVASLATYFSPVFGPAYYAGLWQKLLLQQLCWQSASDTTSLTRPTHYRAPSWSWASVEGGPLYFRFYLPNSYQPYRCELVECKTSLKSESLPFGEVTGGYLKLRAVLREGQFHPTRSQKITWQATRHEQDDDHSVQEGEGYWDCARGMSDAAQDNVDQPVVCLSMYVVEGMRVEKIGGMMLSHPQDGLFRRIGRFTADKSDFDQFLQQEVTIV